MAVQGQEGGHHVGNNLKDQLVWFSCLLSLTHEEFVALNLAECVAPLLSYRKDSKPQELCDLVLFTYISSMCSANPRQMSMVASLPDAPMLKSKQEAFGSCKELI